MKTYTEEKPYFRYTEPAPLNVKLLLLTKDDRHELGPWKGAPVGEHRTYKAWSGFPRQNGEVERALGLR